MLGTDHQFCDYFGPLARTNLTRRGRHISYFAIIEVMDGREYFGEFELLIMLTLIGLGEEAYGVPISREIERHRKREVSVSSVYAALDRLERKGLVSSRVGEATPQRGGKAKRYFQVTREGLRALRQTRQVLTTLWNVIPDRP